MFLGIIEQVLWYSYVFTVIYLLQLFFSHLSVCNCKGSTAEKKFSFTAWQMLNNLLPIAKKL